MSLCGKRPHVNEKVASHLRAFSSFLKPPAPAASHHLRSIFLFPCYNCAPVASLIEIARSLTLPTKPGFPILFTAFLTFPVYRSRVLRFSHMLFIIFCAFHVLKPVIGVSSTLVMVWSVSRSYPVSTCQISGSNIRFSYFCVQDTDVGSPCRLPCPGVIRMCLSSGPPHHLSGAGNRNEGRC